MKHDPTPARLIEADRQDRDPKRSLDQDVHKGAKEEDRPVPEQSSHPGLDKNGLPNDPTAIAQDALGANEDKTQG